MMDRPATLPTTYNRQLITHDSLEDAMLDITIIREQAERVKQAMHDLNDPDAAVRIDLILELDHKRRALLTEVEQMRAEKNAASKKISSTNNPQERQAKIDQMKSLNAR